MNKVLLSTPHGTLGTSLSRSCSVGTPTLSTPHGTLGTRLRKFLGLTQKEFFQLHTVH